MTVTPIDAFLGIGQVPRDGYDRPLIQPEGGGEPEPYTRVSTFAESLEEIGGLLHWKSRETAKGIARHEDLAAMVAALTFSTDPDDKKRKAADRKTNKLLDGYIEEAICRVDTRAAWGTAVHGFTEGDTASPFVPERMKADVDSYYTKLEALGLKTVMSEQFVVHDALKVAGTFDHVYDASSLGLGLVLADTKTGSMHPQKVSLQLACYASAALYDVDTHARTPLGVNQQTALLVHIPKGKGETEFYTVDLEAGRAAAKAAQWVRAWRSRDDLVQIVTPLSATA